MSGISDHALLEDVAERAAKKAVSETLIAVGVDIHNPIEMQRDIAFMRDTRLMFSDKKFQQDLEWVRDWRETTETIKRKGVATATGFFVLAVLGAIIVGFKSKLGIG